jgi:hypothetical protein
VTDKLSIYSDALLMCGERALSSLTEDREPRHLLDQVWDNGGVDACLEQGQWHFAMASVRMDYDPAVEPEFGYRYAFDKPDDWILTSALCSDEYFRVPITRYNDEDRHWYADEQIIYLKYVSNETDRGTDYANWPVSFKDFVTTYFASRIVLKVTGDQKKLEFLVGANGNGGELKKAKVNARNRAAMALPTSFPARGSWVNARQRGRQQDGGNRNGPLIG